MIKIKDNQIFQVFRGIQYRDLIISILLLVLISIPNNYTLLYSSDLQNNLIMKVAYIMMSTLVYLILMVILGVKNFFRLGIVFILLGPLEIIFLKSTGMPITAGFIDAIINTNRSETFEQIQSNITIIISTVVIFLIYIILLSKLNNFKINSTLKFIIIGCFIAFNGVVFIQMFKINNNDRITLKTKLEISKSTTIIKYEKIFPVNLFINTFKTYETRSNINKMSKDLEGFYFNASSARSSEEEEIYILIIGETARYQNFGINGYSRNTTPFLSQNKNLVSYSNVYSGAILTSISVPQIITRATPEESNIQFKEKSISEAFKEAGYYSSWIANQSLTNPLIQRISKNIDHSYFTESKTHFNNNYDINTFDELQKVLQKPHKKKFIVIHTYGSHYRYSNRYPKEFEKFRPAISQIGYDNISYENKESLVNAYDNTILYTDFFIDKVIKEVESKNTISALVYLSDHGENLYDDERRYILHGSDTPIKYEYHIPFIIWTSNEYQKKYADEYKNILDNRNKKVASTNTFYTLLNMAGINYKNSDKEIDKSVASPLYKEPIQRKLITGSNEIINVP